MLISSSKLIDRICELIDSIDDKKSALLLEKRVVSNYTQNLIIIDEEIAYLKGQIIALGEVLDLIPECKVEEK